MFFSADMDIILNWIQIIHQVSKQMKTSTVLSAVRIVKDYAELMIQDKPVRPWTLLKYSADAAICRKLYGSNIADYFELHFYEKPHRERKTYFTANQARRFIKKINGAENNSRFNNKINMYHALGQFTKR